MKKQVLRSVFALMPILASAVYAAEPATGNNYTSFASEHRFYVGGAYNFSMWSDNSDVTTAINGKNTSSFDTVAGIRFGDSFRVEANYAHTRAKWDAFQLTGNTVFVNALFDARVDSMYRLFRPQAIIPYVGAGAGMSWNSGDGVHLDKKISPVAMALAGFSFEIGEYFALDFGYRYMYIFNPGIDTISDFNPIAHQFRAGVRINL